jgi:hypothetical protein
VACGHDDHIDQPCQTVDPHALLCLELEWIEGAGLDAAHLGAEKLRAHVELLKEQATELETECYRVRFHPRYTPEPVIIQVLPRSFPAFFSSLRRTSSRTPVIAPTAG